MDLLHHTRSGLKEPIRDSDSHLKVPAAESWGSQVTLAVADSESLTVLEPQLVNVTIFFLNLGIIPCSYHVLAITSTISVPLPSSQSTPVYLATEV